MKRLTLAIIDAAIQAAPVLWVPFDNPTAAREVEPAKAERLTGGYSTQGAVSIFLTHARIWWVRLAFKGGAR